MQRLEAFSTRGVFESSPRDKPPDDATAITKILPPITNPDLPEPGTSDQNEKNVKLPTVESASTLLSIVDGPPRAH